MMRIGLTSRLALAGIGSALLPFLVGGAILLAVPDRVARHQVDPELDRASAQASARIQERRARLEFALARIDPESRSGAAATDEALARQVRRAWVDAGGGPAGSLDVAVRADGVDRSGDDVVAAYLVLHTGDGARELVAQERGGAELVLRDVADDLDVGLAAVVAGRRSEPVGADAAGEWTARVVDGDLRFAPDAPRRWRATTVDRTRGISLVAAVDGGPVALLLRGWGGELQVALALLLAAGMLGGIAIALMMNRMLRRVASSAERMSGGDFEVRLPVVGGDAGARVASSLNGLATELQERIGTLERTVDQLDRTLSAIDDGVCAWDETGRIATWNAGAARITGVDSASARSGVATSEQLREQRRPGRRRILLPLADGMSHLAVDLSVRRMKGGGILQVFRDAAPALSIEQARTNFLVTAAHELRTPLTSILGFAATLADPDLTLSPELRAASMTQLLADAQRLDVVVDSLFESSLLARDKVEVLPEPVEAVDAVAVALQACGTTADGVDVDMPAEGVVIRADRRALTRALTALLDNALKYGSAPVSVSVRAEARHARIAVRDHGAGIPPELQEAIFEPFHRLDPEMRSAVGGAGMGLYTARRLVEAMGGRIEVESQPHTVDEAGVADGDPETTTFTIELPTWSESMRSGAAGARLGRGART